MRGSTIEVLGKFRIYCDISGSFQILTGIGRKAKWHGTFPTIEKARERMTELHNATVSR